MVTYKSAIELDSMRQAGFALATALGAMRDYITPGQTSTLDLDDVAREVLQQHGARPALLGYQPSFSDVPWRHAVCCSINEEVIHGVPSAKRILQEGDIVSLDMDASVDDWIVDAAITVPVGRISPTARNLLTVTREALHKAITQAQAGNRVGDISAAIQRHVERHNYSVVRSCSGHGIGRAPHEDPLVPCYGRAGTGMRLNTGMTLCIEPMVNVGTHEVMHYPGNNWMAVTADGSLSSHFEHTVAITETGPEILTYLS